MKGKAINDHAPASCRERLCQYALEKYRSSPERLWERFPKYLVLRHADNQKWYGLIMDVPLAKLGLAGDRRVDILNVKLGDPALADFLVRQKGYFKGYHISRGNWVSILLNGAVPWDDIRDLLDESFMATASRLEREALRPPQEWLIPANPKYYDVERAFQTADTIDWKQGAGIKKGDSAYMYVAAPVSAILYKCLVVETGLPCDYRDGRLTIKTLMRITLQERYDPDMFTLDVLRGDYGIFSIRGPRKVPASLSEALNCEVGS